MSVRSLIAAVVMVFTVAPALATEYLVEPTKVVETKAVFGQVKSRTVVPARARIGGTVREITVDEGAQVTEGQVIAVVVDDKLAIQRRAAAAQVQAVRSQLDNAQTELERAGELLARGTGPQSRVDQAQTQVQVYTNQLAAAEAEQAVIEQQAKEGSVLAPANGRVLDVPVTPGSVVLAGEEIASIAGGGYFLRLSLPERHAAAIREGDTVAVGQRTLSSGGREETMETRDGRLAKVYPEISGGRVEADVEVEGLGDYFVGERTLVWIPVGRRSVIAIPPEAVKTHHGIDTVRLTSGQGAAEVPVVLGETMQTQEGGRIEVLTGLVAGDTILLP
ncbi:efflux RND transporter periplasmic adaptor subunit [Consotaella aegiceratis]|uniref:efflux RND transporter periplasmic adaptor subunit n=1 Tax=Consotaella aegiceratis TaxID=3097961 RepID=UPI002F3FAB47